VRIYTVNIKADMPTAEQAMRRVTAALATGKQMGAAAVKIIHGYGSTGNGGVIRTKARSQLVQLKGQGKIRAVIPGEQFSIFGQETLRAFALCPALRQDCDLERSNNGITVVVL
jgi:hypothetical protein